MGKKFPCSIAVSRINKLKVQMRKCVSIYHFKIKD